MKKFKDLKSKVNPKMGMGLGKEANLKELEKLMLQLVKILDVVSSTELSDEDKKTILDELFEEDKND